MDSVNEMISQNICCGKFELLYEELDAMGFDYSFGNFPNFQDGAKGAMRFAYLRYAIAREENVQKHVLICEELYAGNICCFDDIWPVIGWHLRRALELSSNSAEVLEWILSKFSDSPDSPFSRDELAQYENMLQNA